MAKRPGNTSRRSQMALLVTALASAALLLACSAEIAPRVASPGTEYPWHRDIVSTTFWVGEVHDPEAADGSQVYSTYDSQWERSYGGCDGIDTPEGCFTEPRTADNDYFPTQMTPLENPFYLDLPYDDVNHPDAFANRGTVVPWAAVEAAGNPALLTDRKHSFMKNRWVKIQKGDRVCYGQIQDAGPAEYNDVQYVFGADDARPVSKEFNGAGMDVSPALNGCLGFSVLNGKSDLVDWQFVDGEDVPEGPWTRIITTRQVQ